MEKQRTPRKVFFNPIFKDKATVIKTSNDTAGAYLLGELEVAPGGGNFMHTHSAFEETFTAIKGKLGLMVQKEKFYLQPGESVTIPRNTPHRFFNDSLEIVSCYVKFTPGHDGFAKGIAIAYGLAADGKTNSKGIPKSLTHLALLIDLTDTRPTGILGWLYPLFKWLAKRARRNGVEEALLEKYYYEDVQTVDKLIN